MNTAAEFDIVVYGASGFTGRLVAEYLDQRHGVGGRSEMGDGGAQPREARRRARRDRRARRRRRWLRRTPTTRPRWPRSRAAGRPS